MSEIRVEDKLEILKDALDHISMLYLRVVCSGGANSIHEFEKALSAAVRIANTALEETE